MALLVHQLAEADEIPCGSIGYDSGSFGNSSDNYSDPFFLVVEEISYELGITKNSRTDVDMWMSQTLRLHKCLLKCLSLMAYCEALFVAERLDFKEVKLLQFVWERSICMVPSRCNTPFPTVRLDGVYMYATQSHTVSPKKTLNHYSLVMSLKSRTTDHNRHTLFVGKIEMFVGIAPNRQPFSPYGRLVLRANQVALSTRRFALILLLSDRRILDHQCHGGKWESTMLADVSDSKG